MSIDVGIVISEIFVSKDVLRPSSAVKLARCSKDRSERRAPMPFRTECAHNAVIDIGASDPAHETGKNTRC
jgi:hypothetical protein